MDGALLLLPLPLLWAESRDDAQEEKKNWFYTQLVRKTLVRLRMG